MNSPKTRTVCECDGPGKCLEHDSVKRLERAVQPDDIPTGRAREVFRHDFLDGMDGGGFREDDYRFVLECLEQAFRRHDARVIEALKDRVSGITIDILRP
jgi:hypothetical protein